MSSYTPPGMMTTLEATMRLVDHLHDEIASKAERAFDDQNLDQEDAAKLAATVRSKYAEALIVLRDILAAGEIVALRENSLPIGAAWHRLDAAFWTTSQADGVLESGSCFSGDRPASFYHLARRDRVVIDHASFTAYLRTATASAGRAKPGKEAYVLERVKAEMRDIPVDELANLSFKIMVERFGASKDTVGRARTEVLAEAGYGGRQ